jgi:ATP-dependent Clp protease ATP-binding subunit ClpA
MTPLVSPPLLDRLSTLGAFLGSQILGQDEVLSEIVSLLQRSFCGLRFPGRPVASMLFLGPTGVGKTETVNLFTEHLFREDKFNLVRLDMSEFMTMDSINILRGDSMQHGGMLQFYVNRSKGSGVLLFDEIEKAHPLIMDVFLQILSAGRFTDSTGISCDLSNYVVVATSNVGSRMLMESRSTDRETLIRRTIQAGTQDFRPETFARFDLHAIFNKLDYLTLKKIGQLHVDKCVALIEAQGHSIEVEPGVVEHVQREGYSERFGARPMQNAAMRILGDVVSAEMLKNGGQPVSGVIQHDRRTNKCSLDARP